MNARIFISTLFFKATHLYFILICLVGIFENIFLIFNLNYWIVKCCDVDVRLKCEFELSEWGASEWR